MLARVFEEHGLVTTAIALLAPPVVHVKPPRALIVPFPYGYALGRPDDAAFQHRVLGDALELVVRNDTPVIAQFPETLDRRARIIQAADVDTAMLPGPKAAADEVTALRVWYERWKRDHGGRTAVGVSGVPQRRFRPVIRFLEAYARGEEADCGERPPDIPRQRFIRYAIDDLKAFAYEARMAQRPTEDEEALHRWFWGNDGHRRTYPRSRRPNGRQRRPEHPRAGQRPCPMRRLTSRVSGAARRHGGTTGSILGVKGGQGACGRSVDGREWFGPY